MLLAQRDKFRQYLGILEHEERAILERDVDRLTRHVEIEQGIVREIFALEKVIGPLDELYRRVYPAGEREIPPLRESLRHLQDQVLARNESNRALLREKMQDLRDQIDHLRLPKPKRSPYARTPSPTMIDVSG
jgi:hypothetical protein